MDEIRKGLPELPRARVKRLTAAYGIPDYDGWVLVEDPRIAGYFEAVAKHACDGKAASNWVMTEVMHLLNEGMDIETFPVPPDRLADLIHLQKKGKLNVAQARVVFAGMVETGLDARAVAEKRGLEQLSDAEKLQHAVQQAFAANARAVADMKRGKLKARDAIMGHVMRLTRGQANPTLVQELIDRQLLAE